MAERAGTQSEPAAVAVRTYQNMKNEAIEQEEVCGVEKNGSERVTMMLSMSVALNRPGLSFSFPRPGAFLVTLLNTPHFQKRGFNSTPSNSSECLCRPTVLL